MLIVHWLIVCVYNELYRKNSKVQKRGKINLIGRLQLTTERMREEENEGIVQLRILRTQVWRGASSRLAGDTAGYVTSPAVNKRFHLPSPIMELQLKPVVMFVWPTCLMCCFHTVLFLMFPRRPSFRSWRWGSASTTPSCRQSWWRS